VVGATSRDGFLVLINELIDLIPDVSCTISTVHVATRDAAIYTVSQKTSHLWLAITLTHMNEF